MDKQFTFDIEIFSDLFKDAHGFRPRGHEFFYKDTTDSRRQEIWASTLVALDERTASIESEEALAVEEFNKAVSRVIESGANDELTALRWMLESESVTDFHDVEYWLWLNGVLFTDRGKEVIKLFTPA